MCKLKKLFGGAPKVKSGPSPEELAAQQKKAADDQAAQEAEDNSRRTSLSSLINGRGSNSLADDGTDPKKLQSLA